MASCHDCGRDYTEDSGFPDLVIDNSAWAKIAPMRDGGGLLCPSCICGRLSQQGITCSGEFRSGPLSEHMDPYDQEWLVSLGAIIDDAKLTRFVGECVDVRTTGFGSGGPWYLGDDEAELEINAPQTKGDVLRLLRTINFRPAAQPLPPYTAELIKPRVLEGFAMAYRPLGYTVRVVKRLQPGQKIALADMEFGFPDDAMGFSWADRVLENIVCSAYEFYYEKAFHKRVTIFGRLAERITEPGLFSYVSPDRLDHYDKLPGGLYRLKQPGSF